MSTTTVKTDLSAFERLIHSKADSLSDQELLSLDFMLHSAWKRKQGGARVEMLGAEWEQSDFAEAHSKILDEMNKRKFHHTGIDGMGKQILPADGSSAEEVKKSGEGETASDKIILSAENKSSGAGPAETQIEKGLIAKKEIHEFPNVVFDEDGAVDFVRKGKV